MDNGKFYLKYIRDHKYLQILGDAKLVTEDGWKFDVHQVILAQKSIFFRDLFCLYRNDTQDVQIPIKSQILNEILHFVYTGSVELKEDTVKDLMIATDYLQIDELHLEAKTFAKSILSMDNCFEMYIASVKISYERLEELCFRIIQTNFERIVQRKKSDFVEMPSRNLKKILRDNSLLVRGENIVWESILEWTSKDPHNRFKEICDLLQCLKFKDIEESLAGKIIKDVTNNPHCKALEITKHQNLHSSLDTLKKIVENYLGTSEISLLTDFYSRRLPNYLHVFYVDPSWSVDDSYGVYVTYDERIDIWRKLGDVDIHENDLDEFLSFTFVLGNDLYVFADDIQIFDLCEKEWRVIENSFDASEWEDLGILRRNIYFTSVSSVDDKLKVKSYNTENRLWSDSPCMLFVSDWKAVSFENKIFVVGTALDKEKLSMLVQVYDEDSNSWSVVPPPSTYREEFSFVEYHGKLYIIGGIDDSSEYSNVVEVFDIMRNGWSRIDEVPLTFEGNFVFDPEPVAYVFNDQLIVTDNSYNQDEQYVLNETTKLWEKGRSHLRLHYDYMKKMHTISDRQLIEVLIRESRNPETSLEENPFLMHEIDSDDEF